MIAFLAQCAVWFIKAVKSRPVSFPGGAMEKVTDRLMQQCGQRRSVLLMNY